MLFDTLLIYAEYGLGQVWRQLLYILIQFFVLLYFFSFRLLSTVLFAVLYIFMLSCLKPKPAKPALLSSSLSLQYSFSIKIMFMLCT